MKKNIDFEYESIGIIEQRKLSELSHALNKMLTKKEYNELIKVYHNVIERLSTEAKKQGIDI